MAYSVLADVQAAAGGEDNLIALTDQGGTGAVDETVLDAAIADADAWIDTYAGKVRSVSFATTPAVIKRISAQESVYILRTQRQMVTETDQRLHEQNERWLELLAKGMVTVGVEPQPTESELIAPAVIAPADDSTEITATNTEGFW